jgi:hypothetical protein
MLPSTHSITFARLILTLSIGLIISIPHSKSQKIVNTESGQKILIAKDGSWSIVKFNEKINEEGVIVSDTNTNLDAFEAPNAGKHPLTVDQSAQVNNVLKTFKSDEAQLIVNKEFFQKNLDQLIQKRKEAKKDKDADQLANLKELIKITENSLNKTKQDYKKSSKLIASANELLKGNVKNKERAIAKLIQANEMPINKNSGMGGSLTQSNVTIQSDDVDSKDASTEVEKIETATTTQNAVYPKTFKVSKAKHPRDKYECELAFDGYDDVLRANKKEVKTEFFFGHSQEKMKAYFKNDDFITCDANLSKVGRKYYITLKIRVKSKDAKRTYGMLRSKETIRFEMINGDKVYCTSMVQDDGTIEAYTGNTLYTGIYEISKDNIKILKKGYLDNVGIIWSSGYEQYNIFNVDFIKNQLRCLEK